MKYLKLKIEDAVNATKAAIAEGIVPGGGSALAKVSKKLEEKSNATNKKTLESSRLAEFNAGYSAVVEALKEPLRQIAENAGQEAGVVLAEVMKGKENSGYDALNSKFISDMFAEGIIDPVKVTRSALENASSAVATFLTTEVAIAESPEEKKVEASQGMGY
jgi:chaperonin GroEL